MIAHPEGGHYKEVYKNRMTIDKEDVKSDFSGRRALTTSIYFLLEKGEVSHLHTLKSDELWYYHDGDPMTIVIIEDKSIRKIKLGLDIENGQRPQVLVPAGVVFGSFIEEDTANNDMNHNEFNHDFSLVGCMVSFGFDFQDFRLIQADELLGNFTEDEKQLISDMCIKER
jgi:predicted cupin superfamily sugar epimerase